MAANKQNYISETSSRKKGYWIYSALGFALGLVIVPLFLFVFQIVARREFRANPNDAYDTLQAFAYSLAYNKLDGVKSYVSEDKWTFIDTWSNHHQAISSNCKSPSDPDDSPFWMGTFDDGTQTGSIYFEFHKDCPEYFYYFHIDADLKRVDNRWQVIGWRELCEQMTEKHCY